MVTRTVRRGHLVLAIVFGFGLLPLVGCGTKRVPVTGAVTLDGKPLSGGVLTFCPNESKGNMARISCPGPVKGGTFTLMTNAVTQSETGAGVPLGWYKVILVTDLPGQPKLDVHRRFTRVETTPLELEVVETPQPGAYDIQLTSK
ncbi:MAG: hypothetical protein JWO38_1819 [Gemmataceae bacterium]|nr:hypothetical protein [Gemmataceae bacterium]